MKKNLLCLISSIALISGPAAANPWKIQDGSILLDGTQTATYVAGYLFSGEEYEFTSSQINLRCSNGEIEMSLVGDSELLSKTQAETDPSIEFVLGVNEEIIKFDGTIENVNYGRQRARIHDSPSLVEFLRQNSGQDARIQLPVASTGVPEVRKLSLENIIPVSDAIINTCGPLKKWEPESVSLAASDKSPEGKVETSEPVDLLTALEIAAATKLVEELIKSDQVSLEDITRALMPLIDK